MGTFVESQSRDKGSSGREGFVRASKAKKRPTAAGQHKPMTGKNRPEFHDEFSEAEFFGFAKSYLSEGFPNPQRIGCPPDCDLRPMAENPVEARDATVSEHLTCCSPCFNRYLEILAGIKQLFD